MFRTRRSFDFTSRHATKYDLYHINFTMFIYDLFICNIYSLGMKQIALSSFPCCPSAHYFHKHYSVVKKDSATIWIWCFVFVFLSVFVSLCVCVCVCVCVRVCACV